MQGVEGDRGQGTAEGQSVTLPWALEWCSHALPCLPQLRSPLPGGAGPSTSNTIKQLTHLFPPSQGIGHNGKQRGGLANGLRALTEE